jgi:hypothetical protein
MAMRLESMKSRPSTEVTSGLVEQSLRTMEVPVGASLDLHLAGLAAAATTVPSIDGAEAVSAGVEAQPANATPAAHSNIQLTNLLIFIYLSSVKTSIFVAFTIQGYQM